MLSFTKTNQIISGSKEFIGLLPSPMTKSFLHDGRFVELAPREERRSGALKYTPLAHNNFRLKQNTKGLTRRRHR